MPSASSGVTVKLSTGGVSNGTTAAVTSQVSGSSFWISVSNDGGVAPTSVSDSKGNIYSQWGTTQVISSDITLSDWVCSNGVGGSSHTFTVNFAGNRIFVLKAGEVKDSIVNDSGSIVNAIDTGTPFQVTSGTLAQADEYVITTQAWAGGGDPITFLCAGFAVLVTEPDNNSWYGGAVAGKNVSATTPVLAEWSDDSGGTPSYAMGIMGFKSNVSAAATTYNKTHRPKRQSSTFDFTAEGWFNSQAVAAGVFDRDLAYPAAGGVSAALTGVSATGSPGTVGVTVDKSLTGNAGTGSVGTAVPTASVGLTGNSAPGSVGTVTPVRAGAITGVGGTGSAGTVAPSTSAAITGNAATGAVGTATVVRAGALTGAAGTGQTGTVGPEVVVALTGVSAAGAAGTVTAVTDGGDVSAALTGVQAAGNVGTVGPVLDKELTGNAAAGSPGTVTPVRAGAITGNAATGSAGTVGPQSANALTGNAATGAAGTVSPSTSKALTGTGAIASVGSVAPSVTVALTGVSGTGAVGTVSVDADVTQALTGVAATGAVGTVTPSVSIALTGVSATGTVGDVTAGQPLTGVVGTGSTGDVGPSTSQAITGAEATGATGSVGAEITVALTGVQAAGQVGDVAFAGGDVTIGLTGVQATSELGVLQVSGEYSDIAEAVWSYMLSNGKTAGQNVVEIRSMLDTLTPGFWDFVIEGTFTAADLLRVIAAVQAGKSTITPLGGGAATVEFRAVDDSEVRVTADMQGSERTEVTLNAN